MKTVKHFRFLLSLVLLFSLSNCSTDMEEIKKLTEEEELPMLTVQGMRSVYTSNANLKMLLTTPTLYRFDEKNKSYFEFPNGCRINFYNEELEVESSLKADYAIYHEKEQNAKAEGNVVITNANGSILRTEELFLTGETKNIYSVKPVTITYADGSVIQGEGGFKSNFDFTDYRFTKVTGIQQLEEELE